MVAVSYTHLDVYKRQASVCAAGGGHRLGGGQLSFDAGRHAGHRLCGGAAGERRCTALLCTDLRRAKQSKVLNNVAFDRRMWYDRKEL